MSANTGLPQAAVEIVRLLPNPVHNEEVIVEYHMAHEGNVEIAIVSASGEELRRIALGQKGQGSHREHVSLRGLASGAYSVLVCSQGHTASCLLHCTR
ncbi:MAG: hypothetical protein RML40_08210 [Bacteroidota bacterium]|nr:hypothetical protein [Candidatus Kapabacteria bacterium]MDW8220498.1 hypothetical protein [Bacteroidota bacterium]